MAHGTEACIAYNGSLEELKTEVEKLLGLRLDNSESDDVGRIRAFYGSLITIDIELSINNLENDDDLNFSDFSYILSTRTGAGYQFRQSLLELQAPMINVMGLLLCYHLQVDVMITEDVQTLVAKYNFEEVKAKL